MSEFKFHFDDDVRVISGFYEGATGRVIEHKDGRYHVMVGQFVPVASAWFDDIELELVSTRETRKAEAIAENAKAEAEFVARQTEMKSAYEAFESKPDKSKVRLPWPF